MRLSINHFSFSVRNGYLVTFFRDCCKGVYAKLHVKFGDIFRGKENRCNGQILGLLIYKEPHRDSNLALEEQKGSNIPTIRLVMAVKIG